MNLHILFGQRIQAREGEYAPEVLLCWTEYDIDENPEGFDEEVERAQEKAASDFSTTRVIIVQVDQDRITRLLNEAPVVKGKVLEP